ncbi:hypothetical protein [Devosia alba]|uniref:hypothetical protein n=1 Tax=Devosia alba TaxID=3152360 RepID=UPI003264D854
MEPASSIIAKFGGNAKVAQILGAHPARVAKWKQPLSKGGTGGLIPIKRVNKLLAAAQAMDIPLTARDFLPVEGEAAA